MECFLLKTLDFKAFSLIDATGFEPATSASRILKKHIALMRSNLKVLILWHFALVFFLLNYI